MNVLLLILVAALAGAAGYALGMMRGGREAVAVRAALEAERKHGDEALRRQADALRAEFKAVSVEMMRTQGDALREEHLHSLDALLKPLGQDIERFRTQFVAGHASMDRYIKDLVAQTAALGREADDLAKALKGNTKLQGNWGEAVLDNLLGAAGLAEGRDYTLQARTADGQGGTAIPDVVVHLPGGRNVVVDSKVSLKAYADYVAADDAAGQDRLLKEHVRSVRQHVRELSEKDYAKLVPDAIGYVLMFIPGEAAYVAAVTADPSLPTEAYARHVILVNPTNLLMALQLAHNLWQSELQSRSVREIYDSAGRLYKKFCSFSKTFVKIGTGIGQLQRAYDEAHGQLCSGRGNIVSQLEGWQEKGLNPPAALPGELTGEA